MTQTLIYVTGHRLSLMEQRLQSLNSAVRGDSRLGHGLRDDIRSAAEAVTRDLDAFLREAMATGYDVSAIESRRAHPKTRYPLRAMNANAENLANLRGGHNVRDVAGHVTDHI